MSVNTALRPWCRPALRLLHGLLLSNVDLLLLDANPATLLPSPLSLGLDVKLQCMVLAWYMGLMAEVRLGKVYGADGMWCCARGAARGVVLGVDGKAAHGWWM